MTDGDIDLYDIAIIGGGINGCGIARDAAGRGLKVFLCEQADLASGTSSASSKLIHGGLRYLEHYEFGLVRESLQEREILLKAAPHLIQPIRFLLPHHPKMRPVWLIRLGLLLYDLIGGKRSMPRSRWVKLEQHHGGSALRTEFTSGFEYADCWTDDSRLVVSVAKDAHRLGARISTGTLCNAVYRSGSHWEIGLCHRDGAPVPVIRSKTLVNATGPWVSRFIEANADGLQLAPDENRIMLVQGSHIVVKKWFDHNHAYILQNEDNRIVFVIPFQHDMVIIGTTDVEYQGDPAKVRITPDEIDYLFEIVNQYFTTNLLAEDIIWSFSGVRPLYDDGTESPQEATRDYVIKLDAPADLPPIINIYGGKLTTFRRLAEAVLVELTPYFPDINPPWTADLALPGANIFGPVNQQTADSLFNSYPFLPESLRLRYLSAYGSEAIGFLGEVKSIEGMGQHFGHGLYQIEVIYLIKYEWAISADDILWRRSKLGLYYSAEQTAALSCWLASEFGFTGDNAEGPAPAGEHVSHGL